MSYQWIANDGVVLAEEMASFWIYCNFSVNRATKKLNVSNGFFATYISHDSNKVLSTVPTAAQKSFSLSGSEGTIKLNHATLVRTRLSYVSNEYNRLHLFEFDANENRTEWISSSGWTSTFQQPTSNKDGTKFLNHTITFGEVDKRYAYQVVSDEDAAGTCSLGVVVPFLKTSVLATLLTKHEEDDGSLDKGQVPELCLTFQGTNWEYFKKDLQQWQGNVRGYVMVAQGAFKSINPTADLERWQLVQDGIDKRSLAETLSRVACEATEFKRKLVNIKNTERNAVVKSVTGDQALEVIYLGELNSENPVKSLLQAPAPKNQAAKG
jgi:hypothetical protein